MRIEQKKEFQPITITLETRDEAVALWGIIESRTKVTEAEKCLAKQLREYLSNNIAALTGAYIKKEGSNGL